MFKSNSSYKAAKPSITNGLMSEVHKHMIKQQNVIYLHDLTNLFLIWSFEAFCCSSQIWKVELNLIFVT